jgi:hypothetical protein
VVVDQFINLGIRTRIASRLVRACPRSSVTGAYDKEMTGPFFVSASKIICCSKYRCSTWGDYGSRECEFSEVCALLRIKVGVNFRVYLFLPCGGVVDSPAGARRTVATVSRTGDMSVSKLSKSTHKVLSCMQTDPIVRGTSASRCVGAIEPTRVPACTMTWSGVEFAIKIDVVRHIPELTVRYAGRAHRDRASL